VKTGWQLQTDPGPSIPAPPDVGYSKTVPPPAPVVTRRADPWSRSTGPVVSVVIPNRNRCALTMRAIMSVLRQPHQALDIIVVDDASTEDLTPLTEFLVGKPVRLIRNPKRMGAAESRNIGVDAAVGQYVAFLDSADYWLSYKVARQLALLRGMAQPGIIAGGLAFSKKDRVFLRHYPVLEPGEPLQDYLYLRGGVLQTSTFMMPIDIARNHRFDSTLSVHQDTDFVLRAADAGIPVYFDPTLVAIADSNTSRERITTSPNSLPASLEWFRRTSRVWKESTRRAFLRHDYAARCARAGRRGLGLRYYFAGAIEANWSLRAEIETLLTLTFGMALVERIRTRLAPLRAFFAGRNFGAPTEFESFHADTDQAQRMVVVSRAARSLLVDPASTGARSEAPVTVASATAAGSR